MHAEITLTIHVRSDAILLVHGNPAISTAVTAVDISNMPRCVGIDIHSVAFRPTRLISAITTVKHSIDERAQVTDRSTAQSYTLDCDATGIPLPQLRRKQRQRRRRLADLTRRFSASARNRFGDRLTRRPTKPATIWPTADGHRAMRRSKSHCCAAAPTAAV
jgi:hypothetical protein